jgi:transcriptional regulator with XRE-family HTH domain
MGSNAKKKSSNLPTVMRRMRESAELTMRQVGAMIGVSHVAISQFENGKLELPDYRVEQLVKAYGFSMEEFNKIMGKAAPVVSPKDDCFAMLDRLTEEQIALLRSVMVHLLQANTAGLRGVQ